MGSPHTFGAAAGSGSGPGAGGGPALAQRQLRTPCSVDDGGWLEDLRRLVAFASRRLRLQSFDREEIMEEAALRVQEALRRNTPSCESELRAILVMNVRRAIEDFCRAAMRRATHERLTEPARRSPGRPARCGGRWGRSQAVRTRLRANCPSFGPNATREDTPACEGGSTASHYDLALTCCDVDWLFHVDSGAR